MAEELGAPRLYGEAAGAVKAVRESDGRLVVKLAFEFLVLTATRSGEVRRAAWTEIDRDEAVWTIPARRTKGNCRRRKNRAIDFRAVQDRAVQRFAGVRPAGLNPLSGGQAGYPW